MDSALMASTLITHGGAARLAWALAAVTWMAACFPSFSLDEDVALRCASDADCPTPTTCQVSAGLCVQGGQVIDVDAPALLAASANAARAGADDVVTVQLTFSEPVTSCDVVTLTADAVILDGAVATLTFTATGLPEGPLSFEVLVADDRPNTATLTVTPGVVVDLAPPAAIDATVEYETARDNVLFPAAADGARVDSVAILRALFTEDVTVEDVTVGAVTAAPTTAELAVEGARITLTLGPDRLRDAPEGESEVIVGVVDDVGNRARVALPVPLLRDTTPPPAPTLSLLRRRPFGAESPDADALGVTRAEGLAGDAVFVLALPDGVVVDPARIPSNVARTVVSEGRFSLDVAVDIPALRVVAVDAAGNLSATAGAVRLELVSSVAGAGSPHALQARPVASDHLIQAGDRRVDDDLRSGGSISTSPSPVIEAITTVRNEAPNRDPLLAPEPIGGGVIAVIDGQTFRVRDGQVQRLEVPGIPARTRATLVTDEDRGVVVLMFGEDGGGTAQNGVFEFDGARWREVLPHAPTAGDRPSPRVAAAATFVPGLGVVVGGGCGATRFDFLGCPAPLAFELWAWDGAAFSKLCDQGCGESPRPIAPQLAVDDGVIVAYGGDDDSLQGVIISNDPPPALRRFENGAFVEDCSGDCARSVPPIDGVLFSHRGELHVVGTCLQGGACDAVVDGGSATRRPFNGRLPGRSFDAFQPRAGAFEQSGRLLVAAGAFRVDALVVGGSETTGVVAVPAAMNPRVGGAMIAHNNELVVVGGCSALSGNTCTSVSSMERVEAPGAVVIADAGVAGRVRAANAGGTPVLLQDRVESGATVVDIRRAATPGVVATTVTIVPAPSEPPVFPVAFFLAAAFSGGAADTLQLVVGEDQQNFPPVTFVPGPTLRVGLDGSVTTLCSGECGVNVVGGVGPATADAPDGRGLMLGGVASEAVIDGVVVVGEDGRGTRFNGPRPPARRGASAVFDPERQVTWLIGGTASGSDAVIVGQDPCGAADAPADCEDVWRFDGDDFEQVHPLDLVGVGRLPGRRFAQAGSAGGGVVFSGGVIGFGEVRRDAWAVRDRSTTSATHQLHATLVAFGDDGDDALTGLSVRWCGEARDATGNTVADVDLRVWSGGAWRSLSTAAEIGGCVIGTLAEADLPEDTGRLVRGPTATVVVEVVPLLQRTGALAPRLTTTHLTLTTIHAP